MQLSTGVPIEGDLHAALLPFVLSAARSPFLASSPSLAALNMHYRMRSPFDFRYIEASFRVYPIFYIGIESAPLSLVHAHRHTA